MNESSSRELLSEDVVIPRSPAEFRSRADTARPRRVAARVRHKNVAPARRLLYQPKILAVFSKVGFGVSAAFFTRAAISAPVLGRISSFCFFASARRSGSASALA